MIISNSPGATISLLFEFLSCSLCVCLVVICICTVSLCSKVCVRYANDEQKLFWKFMPFWIIFRGILFIFICFYCTREIRMVVWANSVCCFQFFAHFGAPIFGHHSRCVETMKGIFNQPEMTMSKVKMGNWMICWLRSTPWFTLTFQHIEIYEEYANHVEDQLLIHVLFRVQVFFFHPLSVVTTTDWTQNIHNKSSDDRDELFCLQRSHFRM